MTMVTSSKNMHSEDNMQPVKLTTQTAMYKIFKMQFILSKVKVTSNKSIRKAHDIVKTK